MTGVPLDGAAEDEGDIEWAADVPIMAVVEERLRCGICTDFYEWPVTVPRCGHVFCSVCVRRSLKAKQECPMCRARCAHGDLRPNHTVEALSLCFRAGLPYLHRATTEVRPLSEEQSDMERVARIVAAGLGRDPHGGEPAPAPAPSLPNGLARLRGSSHASSPRPAAEAAALGSSVAGGGAGTPAAATSSAADKSAAVRAISPAAPARGPTSARPAHTPEGGQSSLPSVLSGAKAAQQASSRRVPCPSCGTPVPTARINRHLDRCVATTKGREQLQSEGSREASALASAATATLPLLNYSTLKVGAPSLPPFPPDGRGSSPDPRCRRTPTSASACENWAFPPRGPGTQSSPATASSPTASTPSGMRCTRRAARRYAGSWGSQGVGARGEGPPFLASGRR